MHQKTMEVAVVIAGTLRSPFYRPDALPDAILRAGLTMVPNVPWHRAPAVRGPPRHEKKFSGAKK